MNLVQIRGLNVTFLTWKYSSPYLTKIFQIPFIKIILSVIRFDSTVQ